MIFVVKQVLPVALTLFRQQLSFVCVLFISSNAISKKDNTSYQLSFSIANNLKFRTLVISFPFFICKYRIMLQYFIKINSKLTLKGKTWSSLQHHILRMSQNSTNYRYLMLICGEDHLGMMISSQPYRHLSDVMQLHWLSTYLAMTMYSVVNPHSFT